MIVRELLTKFGFSADLSQVEKFKVTVDQAKAAADKMAAGVGEAAKKTDSAFGKMLVGAKTFVDGLNKSIAASQQGATKTGTTFQRSAEQIVAAAKAIKTTLGEIPHELAAIDQQALIFGHEFDAARAKVEALAASMRKLTMSGMAASHPELQALTAQYQAAIAGVRTPHGSGGMFGGIGHHMMMLGAGYMGFQAAEHGVEHFAEFQQELQKAGATMRATAEEIEGLRRAALDLSASSGFTPRQLAESLKEIAGHGFKADEAKKLMPVAAEMARAGMTDMKTSVDLLASTTRAFYGEDVSKARSVGDAIMQTHDVGAITPHEIQESLKYVAPVAKTMGQTLEDTLTGLAVMGRGNLKGTTAGNALKDIYLHLAAPAIMNARKLHDAGLGDDPHGAKKGHKPQGDSIVHRLGITIADPKTGNMLPIGQILKQFADKTKHMGNVQQAKIIKDAIGLQMAPEMMTLLNNAKSMAEVSEKIHHSNGVLKRMNDIMTQGLTPAWQRFTAKAEVLADLLIEKMAPSMIGVLDAVSALLDGGIALVNWFDEVTDNGKKLEPVIGAIKGALIAVTPFVVALIGLTVVEKISAWSKAFWALTTSLEAAAVANRALIASVAWWGILIGAVALAGLVLEDYYTYLEGGDAQFKTFYPGIDGMRERLETSVPAVKSMQDALTEMFSAGFGQGSLSDGIGDMDKALKELPKTTKAGGDVFGDVFMGIIKFFERAREAGVAFASFFIDQFVLAGNLVIALFQGDIPAAIVFFKAMVKTSFDDIVVLIGTIIQNILSMFAALFGVDLPASLQNIPQAFDSAFSQAYDTISNWLEKGIGKVEEFSRVVTDALGLTDKLDKDSHGSGGWGEPPTDSGFGGGAGTRTQTMGMPLFAPGLATTLTLMGSPNLPMAPTLPAPFLAMPGSGQASDGRSGGAGGVTNHNEVKVNVAVNVGDHASPTQVGHATAQAVKSEMDAAIREHFSSAASLTRRQLR